MRLRLDDQNDPQRRREMLQTLITAQIDTAHRGVLSQYGIIDGHAVPLPEVVELSVVRRPEPQEVSLLRGERVARPRPARAAKRR